MATANVIPGYEELGTSVASLVEASLRDEANTDWLAFPEGNWERTGKAYNRRSVIFTIASQNWSAPPNAAALDRGGVSPQSSTLNMLFYLSSASQQGPDGIFNIKDIILRQLRGIQLHPLLGVCYPISFSYTSLTENCIWEYTFVWGINLLDGEQGKKDFKLIQSGGEPVSSW